MTTYIHYMKNKYVSFLKTPTTTYICFISVTCTSIKTMASSLATQVINRYSSQSISTVGELGVVAAAAAAA